MKRMTYFVMALAMVLGLTQCKKDQIEPQGERVHITLDVDGGNSNSKVVVNPTGASTYATVDFEEGDVIYVAYKGKYVGSLNYTPANEVTPARFSGELNITDEIDNTSHLQFYLLGGNGFTPKIDGNTATVNISDQSLKYPVISYSPSNEAFTGEGLYSAVLKNKVSIMKFNVTTPSTSAICITGMNNSVTVDFGDPNGATNGFTYDQDDGGLIKLKGGSGSPAVKWAIVLPQDALTTTGEAYSEDNVYTGTRPTIHAIEANKYYHEGSDVINMAVNTTTVTWINSYISSLVLEYGVEEIYRGIGVQLDDDQEESHWNGTDVYLYEMGMLTFQIDTDGIYAEYDIKKIEIYYSDYSGNLPDEWSNDGSKLTWEGVSSPSVSLWNQGPEPNSMSITVTEVVFTLEKSAK